MCDRKVLQEASFHLNPSYKQLQTPESPETF